MSKGSDLLFFRATDGYVAFSPSRGAAFRVNSAAFSLFQRALSQGLDSARMPGEEVVLARLRQLAQLPVLSQPTYDSRKFSHLVLLLTHECNMRCAYCYARAGQQHGSLSFDTAARAVDYITRDLLSAKRKGFGMSFHGGGEPTLAWETLQKVYAYAKDSCRRHGLDFRTRLTSNGIWTDKQSRWIAANIHSVLLSVDGPEDVMESQRPTRSGVPALPVITRSIHVLKESGHRIKIRSTISDGTVSRLVELVEFLTSLGASSVQLEPLALMGRAATNAIDRPDATSFCANFIEARKFGRTKSCTVSCSYLRPIRYAPGFCGALGNVFTVSPEGNISTCHRVDSSLDDGAAYLLVGKIGATAGDISVDAGRLEVLLRMSTERPAICGRCVAQYSCGGGCYAQNASITGNIRTPDPYRCKITRVLTKHYIQDSLDPWIQGLS